MEAKVVNSAVLPLEGGTIIWLERTGTATYYPPTLRGRIVALFAWGFRKHRPYGWFVRITPQPRLSKPLQANPPMPRPDKPDASRRRPR